MRLTSLLATASALALALLVSGCATPPPPLPPELQYQAPEADAEAPTILGSQEKSGWADDFTVFIRAVDGKRVMAGRKGWETPLPLRAGDRRLVVEFNRGAFFAGAVMMLPAAAGAHYELRYTSDVGFNGTNTYCDFWIVDLATGKAVTDVVRGRVGGGGGGGAVIPIFIPRK